MDEEMVKAAERQRNKTIAAILTVKDELQDVLSEEDAEYLRKTILDEINHYHNSVMDLLIPVVNSSSGAVLNEKYLEMIEDIHRRIGG